MSEPSPDHDSTAPTTTAAAAHTLNDLPQDILLRILSFLPTVNAVQTSLISQRWRSLWSLNSSLHFSWPDFPPITNLATARQFFSEFIDRTLILRPVSSPLLRFHLAFIFRDRYRPHIESWVRYAVKNNVQELLLDFFIDGQFHYCRVHRECYDFPFSVLAKGNVRHLKLVLCHLTLPANVLPVLTLKHTRLDRIYLTDEMVVELLKGCPNLEVLEMDNCYGMEKLRVCSGKLKELMVSCFCSDHTGMTLEIDCPNLEWLSIVRIQIGELRVRNVSSSLRFHALIEHRLDVYEYWSRIVSVLDQLPSIRCLMVQNWWLKFSPKDVFPKSFMFYDLKHLELKTGYTQYDLLGMAALLEMAPNLETMILDYLDKMDEDESLSEELSNKEIHLSMPSLKEVKFNAFTESEDEINFLDMLKRQGVVLQKIVIVPVQVVETHFRPIILHICPQEVNVDEGSSR